jgi:hypothetical protein
LGQVETLAEQLRPLSHIVAMALLKQNLTVIFELLAWYWVT